MNMKDAIEFLEKLESLYIHTIGWYENLNYRNVIENHNEINETIKLLKCGEKYETMWGELLEGLDFMSNKEKLHMNWEDINDLMIKIMQKYSKEEEK